MPTVEILAQLAEESSELAQAALKLRREKMGTNPTQVSEEEALNNLCEEFADVLTCFCEIGLTQDNRDKIFDLHDKKLDRWISRLKGGESNARHIF